MVKGRLYGVSVGPGDPELLTLRAVHVLQAADWVAAPQVGQSARIALSAVERYIAGKPILDCPTPMTRDRRQSARAYDAIAEDIAGLLDGGYSVAFITLGDASIYSTWSYVCERLEGRGYGIQVIPGVTSFCAAAATLREPLCQHEEQLLVSPVAAGDPAAALAVPGTKVFMKAGRQVEKLRDLLVGSGQAANASIVANCGLPDETVVRGLPAQGELPGYLSVTIVKDVPSTTSACPQPTQPHPALRDVARSIAPPVEAARKRAQAKWNAVAKPIGGLGVLEDDIVRIAALRGTEDVRLSRRAVAVLCADNGVAAEGVSQCGQEVTAAVAANIARGVSSVCKMAATARADAFACDLGMACPPATPGIVDLHVARGAGNIARGPAMSQEEALRAIYAGIEAAAMLQGQGYDIVAAGEMGIGNTTTSSAIAAVLLDLPAQRVVGRGAGLSDEGLQRKTEAVKRAIAANQPDRDDALDVLAKLGGFDIAGLVGLYLGCAMHRMPVVIDGFIGTLAAVVAARLVPACTVAMIASHVSAEPAARLLLGELGLQPAIDAGLHLGEGTGAVCLLPLLDAALALYNGTTFEETGIDAYEVHPQG